MCTFNLSGRRFVATHAGEEAQDTLRVCRPLGVVIYKPEVDPVAELDAAGFTGLPWYYGMQLKPVA
ncbi:hypothetical protein ACVXG7_25630 [Enterobacter hormaechei]